MLHRRRIARVITVPPLAPGFIGPGHLAAPVLSPEDFVLNDPFILLAYDHLDIGERPVGGPHPHAGFETVTLLLDGALYDRDEGGVINTGEVQWMTAGSGIIHGEHVMTKAKVRLLQLWLVLPKNQRWTTPEFQDIHSDAIPVRREPGVDVRIYSGRSGNFQSATRNHVPVTITEIKLDAHASIDQELPLSYNGFVYVIGGSARIGEDGTLLQTGRLDGSIVPMAAGQASYVWRRTTKARAWCCMPANHRGIELSRTDHSSQTRRRTFPGCLPSIAPGNSCG